MAVESYLGINIDYGRDQTYDEFPLELIKKHYLKPYETSPQQAIARAAICFCYGDYALAQRIYDYVSLQQAAFASPIFSNAVLGHWVDGADEIMEEKDAWLNIDFYRRRRKNMFITDESVRAMPISCFLTYVPDDIQGQIKAAEELANLSIVGGGVGQYLGMRGVTPKSPGAIPYLKTMDSNILYYHQAGTRRGSVAAYLDISHPDIVEFIGVRTPTGGDVNRKCLNIHNAVNITDDFLEAVDKGGDWSLRAPNTGEVVEVVKARELWQQIIEARFKTGEPYIHYVDQSNRKLNEAYKAIDAKILTSNLCVVGSTKLEVSFMSDGSAAWVESIEDVFTKLEMGYYRELYVKSYSQSEERMVWSKFDGIADKGESSDIYEIEVEGRTLQCTGDHLILTRRGYVKAKDLIEADELIFEV
jgi:ribonucleoside-diphosphate reductase alpha chain